MRDYCTDQWQAILRHNNLDSFDSLWTLEVGWFESPNQSRGGWSGVSRCDLNLPDGGKVNVFLKRQEGHNTRALLHPFGQPTFAREMENILQFQNAYVPALEPVYFAARKVEGKLRAILCTKALDDYESLDTLVARWAREGWPEKETRLRLMEAIARVMTRMHDHKIIHSCFYPKHIFVRIDKEGIDIRLIDLEKAKVAALRRSAVFRDLSTLNRRSPHWSRSDRLRFFLIYLGLKSLDMKAKVLWRRIAQQLVAKEKR